MKRLTEVAREVYSTRRVSVNHKKQVEYYVSEFARLNGDSLESLRPSIVNSWLSYIESRGVKPETLRSYRSAIVSIWNAAFQLELVGNPPAGLRKISRGNRVPMAWTHEEICKLLYHACDDPYADWINCVVQCTWSTGLRLCDIYQIHLDLVVEDSIVRLRQTKTGNLHTTHLSRDAFSSLESIGGRLPILGRSTVAKIFRRIIADSIISQGTQRVLRRSAASYVEAERPGEGSRFLGHANGSTAHKHYIDSSIAFAAVKGPSSRVIPMI